MNIYVSPSLGYGIAPIEYVLKMSFFWVLNLVLLHHIIQEIITQPIQTYH